MSGLLQDLRFGARLLVRSPVFTMTAAVLLASGIAANTLIFTFLDAVLLRPLPVSNPEQLVRLVEVHPTGFVNWTHPYALCEALAMSPGVADSICQRDFDAAFSQAGSTERIRLNIVTPNFFRSLGVSAQLGRTLSPEDEAATTAAAVLSYPFWQRRFGGDPSVLGRNITLNGQSFQVVGVLPEKFNGLSIDTSPDIRVPLSAERRLQPQSSADREPIRVDFQIFARLRPGFTSAQADAEAEPRLRPVYEDFMTRTYPNLSAGIRSNARATKLRMEDASRGTSALRTQFTTGLTVLMSSVGLLLMMTCANLAGLLLARSAGRRHEVSIRLALGATRSRIGRQFLTESLLLASVGGAFGVVLSYGCLPLLTAYLPPIRDRAAVVQPLALGISIDLRILAFAVGVTMLTALLFGLSPALHNIRSEVAETLRSSRGTTRRLAGRNLVVVFQIAVCTVLLIGAGLLLETLNRLRSLHPGFDRDRIVTFTIDPRIKRYDAERGKRLTTDVLDRSRSLPWVVAAGVATRPLMRGTGVKGSFNIAGTPVTKDDFLNCSMNSVLPGYFEAMGMSFVAGGDFTQGDENGSKPPKVIVNQAFAQRFVPGQDPIGKLFGGAGPDGLALPDNQIIGVVTDARYRSLREPVPPTIYSLAARGLEYGFVLHLRTAHRNPESLIAPVRDILRSIDPELPLIEVTTMRDEVETSLWQERLMSTLTMLFAALAALLAAIGLYGALDYAVKSRTREIGVRVALGAQPSRIVRLLCVETVTLVVGGVTIGILAYIVAAPWFAQILYEVAVLDARIAALSIVAVAIIAVSAATAPIRRAVTIDPSSALRQE